MQNKHGFKTANIICLLFKQQTNKRPFNLGKQVYYMKNVLLCRVHHPILCGSNLLVQNQNSTCSRNTAWNQNQIDRCTNKFTKYLLNTEYGLKLALYVERQRKTSTITFIIHGVNSSVTATINTKSSQLFKCRSQLMLTSAKALRQTQSSISFRNNIRTKTFTLFHSDRCFGGYTIKPAVFKLVDQIRKQKFNNKPNHHLN
ncbi:Hypothetical_protein [Hexamita inflata]|uniref:Hypothetical_protein n=1 Tax=Hexamita inflata TaxID=28002 RepID=A0AA86P6Z1_9EUKA|nr:Hypothetical protein HINF_LOCUS19688 [Hexamita inflata]